MGRTSQGGPLRVPNPRRLTASQQTNCHQSQKQKSAALVLLEEWNQADCQREDDVVIVQHPPMLGRAHPVQHGSFPNREWCLTAPRCRGRLHQC